MIIYHPRNDVFHCMFRMLSIINILNGKRIEVDRLKIIDFYFSFPHLLADTTIPRVAGGSYVKSESKKISVPYENLPNRKILFSEMGDFQLQAIDVMRAKGLIELTSDGWIHEGEQFGLESIKKLVDSNNLTSKKYYQEIVNVLVKCELYGDKGLKMKTGLMEYRYDAV